ncbi:MAG: hypothetical protein HY268_31945 [Deltaproteobacteria bacterium]|nr:hypothetical protein [Deltaproteobacteria bacterium]
MKRVVMITLTLGCVLSSARFDWVLGQCDCTVGTISNMGNAGNAGLNPGAVGGGETIPGAILLKLKGEVHCVGCTLEELGLEATPGDFYQLSREGTHMVIKVTSAAPDIAWEMVEQHKLFLIPGEDATQLQRLLNEGKTGKHVELTGGVAPEVGVFIPITVKVK